MKNDENITIGPKSKMDVRSVVYVISIVLTGATLYYNQQAHFTAIESKLGLYVTQEQLNTWRDNAIDLNRIANGSIVWPRIPYRNEKVTLKEIDLK